MPRQPSITLLHLSDLQFGPKHRFAAEAPDSLFARLRDDLDAMRARHGLVPDLVVITGDLVEYGKPSEFRQFKAFAEAVVEHFGLPRRRLVMIPGNHDINRAAAEAYFKQCEADELSPKPPYWPKLRHYAAMFAEFYAGEPDLTFTEAAPYTLFRYPELGVVVAGLDSTLADSHRAEDHYGFLGEPQLRHFAGELRLAADQGLLRIAAVHHHPIHPEGDPARQDLRDLKRFLGPHLNLVVHGHIHEDELNWLDNAVPVLGIGSAGVKAPQRPDEVPNQYQWIRVSVGGFEYGSRAYVPDQKRWVGDLRLDRDGEQWWQCRAVAFDRVTALAGELAPGAASGDDTLARAVASHRAAMTRLLRRRPLLVDLATFGEDSDFTQGIELLTIFIPQRAMHEVPRSDRPIEPADPRGRAAVEFISNTSSPSLTIDQILTSPDHPWTFILGTPGAGKTTLTMWLALKLCAEGEQLPGLASDFVPVRVELRRFVERWATAHAHGRSYTFFDYLDDVHREESRSLREEVLRELADRGRLLWLFDGLDEVARADHRAEIAGMIVELRAAYGGRGVVTGRIVGCRHLRPRFHAAAVHCFTLHDLSDDQIATFLERWHALVFSHAADLGASRRERLRQTLAANSAVLDLCRNPLLLTLVALLNRGDELPRRRHKLLERATRLMIEQWETNKQMPAVDAIQFDSADKGRFLSELAWHMLVDLSEGAGNIIEGEALERFTVDFCARRFTASPHSAATNARALVQQLRERNYVLGLLGGSQFGFLHKSFFEYFAAEEAVHRFRSQQWRADDLERMFSERWQDDAWVEVLRLICGLLQEDRSEPVVAALQAVLAAPKPLEHDRRIEAITFAVKCLAEVRRFEAGPALAFALALNRHIKAALLLQEWIDTELYFIDDPSHTTKLALAMAETAGSWPGAEQAASEYESDPELDSPYLAHVLLATLPSDARVTLYLKWIEAHALSIDSLRDAASSGLWDERDTRVLQHHLHVRPQISPVLTLAVVGLMIQEDRFDESLWTELKSGAPVDLRPALDQLLAWSKTEEQFDWQGRARIRALFALAALPIVAEPVRVFLAKRWVSHERFLIGHGFSGDDFRAALGPLLEDPGLAWRFASGWQDENALRWCLAHRTSDAEAAFSEYYDAYYIWPESYGVFRAWLQQLPIPEEARRLTEAADALLLPYADGRDLARAVRASIRADGSPDERILDIVSGDLRNSETDDVVRCIDTAHGVYTQTPSRLYVELKLLSSTHEYTEDGEPEWDDELLERFKRTLMAATDEQPWLVLAHLGFLPEAESRAMKERLAAPGFIERLREGEPTLLREHQLKAASMQARELPGAPWEAPLRLLLERDASIPLRIDAALELGDRAWLRRAAETAEGGLRAAARAALDVETTLADLQRVGRLRRAGVWRAGVRVGQLVELRGGATRFTYDREYMQRPGARPIAPNMPLQGEPFDAPGLLPLFEGLLPQGWMRDIDLDKYHLKPGDQFGLLLATGRHTIGALEILPEHEKP